MFFKLSILKKLLKAAYNGAGLTVGQHKETEEKEAGYYISSGWWAVYFLAHEMPKEVKAAIIELCGELPAQGEVFISDKEMGNQYEIEQTHSYDLPEMFEMANCNYRITKLIQLQGNSAIRFLQEEETGNITAIAEVFMELIDKNAIDEGRGETIPMGPVACGQDGAPLLWGNDMCWLMVCRRTTREEPQEQLLWRHLEKIEVLEK